VRGKRNEPSFVVHTVAALAEARGEDAGSVGRRIEQNAATLFSLP
jgi:Tat protein secretion system quality control protein TatD with DNase activity